MVLKFSRPFFLLDYKLMSFFLHMLLLVGFLQIPQKIGSRKVNILPMWCELGSKFVVGISLSGVMFKDL